MPSGQSYKLLAFGAHGVIAAALGRTLHMIDSASGAVMSVIEDAHSPVAYLQWSPVPRLTGVTGAATAAYGSCNVQLKEHEACLMISGQNSVVQVRAKLTFSPQQGIGGCGYGGVSRCL